MKCLVLRKPKTSMQVVETVFFLDKFEFKIVYCCNVHDSFKNNQYTSEILKSSNSWNENVINLLQAFFARNSQNGRFIYLNRTENLN